MIAVARGLAVRVLGGPVVVGGRLVAQTLVISVVKHTGVVSDVNPMARNATISGVLAVSVGICVGEVVAWAGGLDLLPLLRIAVGEFSVSVICTIISTRKLNVFVLFGASVAHEFVSNISKLMAEAFILVTSLPLIEDSRIAMLVLRLVVAMAVTFLFVSVSVSVTSLLNGASTSKDLVSGVSGGMAPATISVNLVVLIEDSEVTLLVLGSVIVAMTVALRLGGVAVTLFDGASSAHVRVSFVGEGVAPAAISVLFIVLVEDGAVRSGVAIALTTVADVQSLVQTVARVALAALGVVVVVVSGSGNGTSVALSLSGELRVAASLVLAAGQVVGSGIAEQLSAVFNLSLSHVSLVNELFGGASAIDTSSVAESVANRALGQILGSRGLVVIGRSEAGNRGQGKSLEHDE